jgi:predicted PurR-regulated permease PerM
VTAALQGALVGVGFWVTGVANPLFWGAVTVVFAILPVVGSGLVWAPGVLVLALDDRYVAAVALAAWGILVVGNVDLVIRPIVFRRWARIHPLTTLVGALAGVPYFGLLGLLIGPLALSYFFELSGLYHEEYMDGARD